MKRILATAISAMLIVTSLAGVAIAADHSGPGDLLYGLDRALEVVGIGSGGSTERLQEVEVLIADGEIEDGLSHANETLDSTPANDAARDAIDKATGRLEQVPDNAAVDTKEKVASLLDYLAENPHALDPAEIVARARDIAPDSPPKGPPADLPGSETGSDNRSDNPSNSRPAKPPKP